LLFKDFLFQLIILLLLILPFRIELLQILHVSIDFPYYTIFLWRWCNWIRTYVNTLSRLIISSSSLWCRHLVLNSFFLIHHLFFFFKLLFSIFVRFVQPFCPLNRIFSLSVLKLAIFVPSDPRWLKSILFLELLVILSLNLNFIPLNFLIIRMQSLEYLQVLRRFDPRCMQTCILKRLINFGHKSTLVDFWMLL
jgi:hypothetical protein